MKTIKISELPLYTSLKGLFTIGTDKDNNSVKVSLEFVEQQTNEAVNNAKQATTAANNAADAANTAKKNADTATTNANNAADKAAQATTAANNAATKANTAADNADKATTAANSAAQAAKKTADDAAAAAKKTADDAATKAQETASAAAQKAKEAAADARLAESNAKEAAENANTAAQGAVTATEQLLLKLGTLIPTGLNVQPVPRLTEGNKNPVYIDARLSPEQVAQNLIFISDNRSVTVTPDGRLTIIGTGRSTIQIIPTLNTALAKVIQVEVGEPTLRLVNTRTRLRLTASGALRLN